MLVNLLLAVHVKAKKKEKKLVIDVSSNSCMTCAGAVVQKPDNTTHSDGHKSMKQI